MRAWPARIGAGAAALVVAEVAFGADRAPAAATDGSVVAEPHHEHSSPIERPHTVAELEFGILTLPNAPLSASNRGGQTLIGTVGSGDATVQTGVHLSYRATPEWAIGARALFAPRPTNDSNYGAGANKLSRTHARSYLFLGGEARYYPLRSRLFEGWLGVTGGAVIIADRFTTNGTPAGPSILGTSTVTVSTEGFAVGIQAGADYLVTDQWVIGLALGADQWILPFSADSSCDPIRDCPTLTGSVRAFEVGLTVGYRLPL